MGKVKIVLVLIAAAVLFLVGAGGLAIGCVILPSGLPDMEVAWVLRNDTDLWEPLGKTCTVTMVKQCWETTDEGICVKSYIPKFTGSSPSLVAGRTYSGWPERFDNDTTACSGPPSGCSGVDAGRMPSGELVVGGIYECWRPRDKVDPRYKCGDRSCVKIHNDPNLIRTRATDKAKRSVGLGGGALVLAVFACCQHDQPREEA